MIGNHIQNQKASDQNKDTQKTDQENIEQPPHANISTSLNILQRQMSLNKIRPIIQGELKFYQILILSRHHYALFWTKKLEIRGVSLTFCLKSVKLCIGSRQKPSY